ncbi:MAG: SnoaL-like domain-containing protein [Cyclobacteriaceae bacterium]
MMNDIHLIANRLVQLVREKKFIEAQQELFSTDAINQEPDKLKDRSVSGLDSILKKEMRFNASIKEWNSLEVSDPLVADDFFSIQLKMEIILRNDQKVALNEIGVYEVRNGKIISERFYF